MKNYVSPGEVQRFTAPAGGVVSGQGYVIGDTFVIATHDAAATFKFVGQHKGNVNLTKVTTDVIADGVKLYWDDTAKKVTVTTTNNRLIGGAAQAAGNGATAVEVSLNGTTLP